MAYVAPHKPGDHHPKIPGAKKFLSRYSYGKNLGDSDEYTPEFGIELAIWAPKRNDEIDHGRPGPKVPTDGSFDWTVQRQMGLDDPPKSPPWIFTVAGHTGGWDNGPAYWSALPLQDQKRARVQGIGYDTNSIPFANKNGTERLHEAVTRFKPPNTDYAIMAHSQGAIIASDYIEQVILQHPDDPAFKGFKGGVMFGNPRRAMGVVAPWIADPPAATHSGIADNCLSGKLPGVEECARKGDLYSDKAPGPAAEYKVAIYRLIARGELFGGTDSLTEQLLEIGVSPFTELWPVFQALIGAIGFGINMDPHNIFDLTPPRDHVARILGI
jgi:hypothetical protein